MLIALFVAAALGFYLCAPDYHAPLYYHLTVGRWIATHGDVPRESYWSEALAGASWASPNAFFQLGISLLETTFGWTGIAVVKLVVCFAFVAVAIWMLGALAGDRFVGGVLALLVSCGVLDSAALSPGLVGVVVFAALVSVAAREKSDGASTLLVFLLAAVGANVHPSIILALVVLAAQRRGRLFVAALAGASLPPYLGAQLVSGVKELVAFASFALREQSDAATVFSYPIAFLALLWSLGALLASRGQRGELRMKPLSVLAGVVSLSALALKSVAPYALVLSGVVVANLYASGVAEETPLRKAFVSLGAKLGRLPAIGALWLLLCVAIVNGLNYFRAPLSTVLLPVHETDFLVEKGFAAPLWSASPAVPYLQYRFADADGNARSKVLYDERSLATHREWFSAEQNGLLREILKTNARTLLVQTMTPLYDGLVLSKDFRLVFENGEPVSDVDALSRPSQPYTWAIFARRTDSAQN